MERTQGLTPTAAYAAWSVAATLVGLAGDLLQPLGPIALILLFVCGVATIGAWVLSLAPGLGGAMRTASVFFLIGTAVFGAIVALQFAAPDGAGQQRGFVAATAPAVAELQTRILRQSSALPEAVSSAPSLASAAPVPTPPLPETEPSVSRSGSFAGRIERMALFWEPRPGGESDVNATISLSFHNLSAAPVSIALLDDSPISLVLDNGYAFGGSDANISMHRCARSQCAYRDLTRVEAGGSLLINFNLRTQASGSWARLDEAQLAALSNTESAAFSARLLVVDDWQGGDRPLWVEDNEAARIIQLGFSNVPISTPEPRR